jgi:TPR repeat protein
MMKAMVVALLLLAAACVSHPRPMPAEPAPSPANSFDLTTDAGLAKTRKAAAGGDVKASVKLEQYYFDSMDGLLEAYFWMTLAAEQGDCSSMVGYAGQLLAAPLKDPKAARFWIDRASASKCETTSALIRQDMDAVRRAAYQ